MLEGYFSSLEGGIEAVRRRVGGDYRKRALAVASVQSLVQVRLLRLGGKSGRRTSSLHINHYQRELRHHGKSHSLALEREAGPRSGGHCQIAGK